MADKKNTAAPEEVNLADVQKQIAQMLEEAKAEAAKIVAEAKAATSGELTEEQKAAIEKDKAYWDELVPVKLFKDNGKYKDDVFVAVNGETCAIKRGEKVMIKRKFAEVLDLSDMQDYETSQLMEQKEKEFARSELT